MLDDIIKAAQKRMDVTVSHFERELKGIRTGQANPELLSNIKVDMYSQQMALEHVARVSVSEGQTITIQTWDEQAVEPIAKAIQSSDLGITPKIAGNTLHLPIPPLNAERRNELVKMIRSRGENARVSVRNVRRDQMEAIKKLEKEGECSADESRRYQARVQGATDKFVEDINEMVARKETEVTKV